MDKDTKAFLATLTPEARRQWLRDHGRAVGEWDKFQADNAPRFGNAPLNGQPAPFQQAGMAQPVFMQNVDHAKAVAADEAAAQNAVATAMGDEVEDAIQRENDSRVAQAREMRRMEHEREMERMRMAAEREKTAALIARLDAQSGKKVIRFPGGMVINGG